MPALNIDLLLADAQALTKAHPETFKAPLFGELVVLKKGHFVKVCIDNAKAARIPERFWVEVDTIDSSKLTIEGLIANDLHDVPSLSFGDEVAFHFNKVYDYCKDSL